MGGYKSTNTSCLHSPRREACEYPLSTRELVPQWLSRAAHRCIYSFFTALRAGHHHSFTITPIYTTSHPNSLSRPWQWLWYWKGRRLVAKERPATKSGHTWAWCNYYWAVGRILGSSKIGRLHDTSTCRHLHVTALLHRCMQLPQAGHLTALQILPEFCVLQDFFNFTTHSRI